MSSISKNFSPERPVFIHGFTLAGYRSFDARQLVGPLGKVNLFIGPNNCGKSNILKLISRHWGHMIPDSVDSSNRLPFVTPDFHGRKERPIEVLVGLPFSDSEVQNFFKKISLPLQFPLPTPFVSGNLLFVPRVPNRTNEKVHVDIAAELVRAFYRDLPDGVRAQFQPLELAQRVCQIGMAGFPRTNDPIAPHIIFIPEFRRISDGEHQSDEWKGEGWSGKGAISLLASLHAPGDEDVSFDEYHDKKQRHKRITHFLAGLINRQPDQVVLEPSANGKTIMVGFDGRFESLKSLGTGIHQAIIFAIVATYFNERILCIEEPETHMHPALQRRLIDYLATQTCNQYFISTHSASFIDSGYCRVFRVQHDGKQSTVVSAITNKEKFRTCEELGYKASDLLQANCIIWVEGPSDAVYVRRWLRDFAPELRDGIDFTVVFYGGTLRGYLQMSGEKESDDPSFENKMSAFADLLFINRNALMLADSDKSAVDEQITDKAKIALESSFKLQGCPIWTTDGRTIENYVRPGLLHLVRKEMHPKSKFPKILSKYSEAAKKFVVPDKETKDNPNRDPHLKDMEKIELATRVCEYKGEIFRKDMKLEALVADLTLFIKDPAAFKERKAKEGATKDG